MFRALLIVPLLVLAITGQASATTQVEPKITEADIQKEFQAVVGQQLLPLTPKQIQEYIRVVGETEKATRGILPKMVSRSQVLNLEPGAPPQVVRLNSGYVASVVFFDATGAPWPITHKSPADEKSFSVDWPDKEPFNLLTIKGLTRTGHSNISLTLKDNPMPVVLQLVTDQTDSDKVPIVDSLVAFRVSQVGPLAEESVVGHQAVSSVPASTMAFLDAVPPQDAQEITMGPQVNGLRVWKYQGKLVIRSKHPLMWPAPSDIASGDNEVRVYSIQNVPSIIVSVGGIARTLNLGGAQYGG